MQVQRQGAAVPLQQQQEQQEQQQQQQQQQEEFAAGEVVACLAASARRRWLMVLVCSTGILLIAKPGIMNAALGGGTTTTQTSLNEVPVIENLTKGVAVCLLIGGAFLHGVSFVLGRHVATRAPPILSIVLMMVFGMISFLPLVCLLSPFHISFFQGLAGGQWVALAIIPFLGLGAQLCLISALEFESAGTIAIVQNLDAVFSYIFQLAIGEGFNAASLGGAALIVCSAVVLAFLNIRKGIKRGRLSAADVAASDEAAEEAKAAEAGSAGAALAAAAAAEGVPGAGADETTEEPEGSTSGQDLQTKLGTTKEQGQRMLPSPRSSRSRSSSRSSSCCSSKSSSKNKTRSSSSRHTQHQQAAAAGAAGSDTDFS
ncbi:hypothetical protein Efla_005198 [Eimeria flavescens]